MLNHHEDVTCVLAAQQLSCRDAQRFVVDGFLRDDFVGELFFVAGFLAERATAIAASAHDDSAGADSRTLSGTEKYEIDIGRSANG